MEEISAVVKAELAKARVQWNKEKQEEILGIQEQNEKDYRVFLDDHRSKINEMLAKAKEDLVKQKRELLDQKEAELKICLDHKQREWAAQETRRLQNEIDQNKEKILVELEFLLREIHEELVKITNNEHVWQDRYSSTPMQVNPPYREKLRTCVQKAYRGTVRTILEKAKQEWREKREEMVRSVREAERSCVPSGEDQKCKKKNLWSLEDSCCERCYQQLEKKERECLDLKRKLEKACRHLQLAVKEHKVKAEQIRENERVVETLMEENNEMKTKLQDRTPDMAPPRCLSEGAVSKPCSSCDGKALEEMRSHYIKAVGKIKGDMLRYIHESKERAAEMIRTEVLRERQETARRMRKYYLICLQQLLKDDRKHEGAERKIMYAASKLATMAKVLETPTRGTPQSRSPQAAMPLNAKPATGVEELKRNYMHQARPAHMESKSCGESIAKKASDQVSHKHVPCNFREQFDAAKVGIQCGLQEDVASNIQSDSSACKQLDDIPRDAASEFFPNGDEEERYGCVVNTDKVLAAAVSMTALQNFPYCTSHGKFGNIQTPSCRNGISDTGPAHAAFQSQNECPFLKDFKRNQPKDYRKATSEKTPGFDVQETPVRDEGSSTNWSSLSEHLHLDSSDVSSYSVPKARSNAQAQSVSCEEFPGMNLFSDADKKSGIFCRPISNRKDKILGAPSEAINYNKEYPSQNSDKLNSALAQQNNAVACSNVGKDYKQHLGKLILDAKSQHDSGFDSPLINFY
uniref:CEP152 CEP63 binding coiled coil domain-containing protein n=1 Tax=Sphenodon punctatus TaxID=8508 RepID=A0A8D0L8B2_SPHPU